ncbi:hypothetical protein [Jeotgalibacillus campisalis]|uniref:Abortive phage infection protein n=1 Tax=Jeotgalibacillus campisalis TaxID=220754 RepID=A0A0C2RB25_9BACL|nr:hypothetical protein [Jeotgalibacillus campisalis]KIL47515.1 hypothetical protein KR50_16820 [Jeotgalibacillus campisalis]
MTTEIIEHKLNELRSGEKTKLEISKEDFQTYREIILAQEDFKHFRGIAQRSGHVIYEYLKDPRS